MESLPIYPGIPELSIETVTPRDQDSGCRACKLGTDKVRTVCMPAEAVGEGDPTLLVVSSSPGLQEDRHGRPAMGATGDYLRKQLEQWPGTVVFDHALRCPPGLRKVLPTMVASCRGYVAGVVREMKPDRILVIGGEACLSVIGRSYPTMSVRRGYVYTSLGIPVMILMPPGPALRNRFVRGWFEEDLKWALTAMPPAAPLDAVVFKVKTPADAREAIDEARCAGGFNWDLETFGHACNWEQTILTAGITPYGDTVAYVWDEAELENPEIRAPLDEALADETLRKAGQNVKFDCVHWQTKYGVVVRGVDYDTKLMRRIMVADSDAKLANLQPLVGMGGGKDEAGAYVDAGVKELLKTIRKPTTPPVLFAHVDVDKMDVALDRIRLAKSLKIKNVPKAFAYAAIPTDLRTRYCATDTISQDRIRQWQEARLENWSKDVWDNTTRDLHYAVTQMEVNGIAVSRSAVDSLRVQMDLEIAQQRIALNQFAPPDFNVNSTDQVSKLLFETLGLPHKGRTKKGFKTTADILEKLSHPAATAVVGLKKSMKFKAQYADGMAFFIRDDGRIHPTVNIDGAQTGRMSCSNPNLFNIPRAETIGGKLCRNIYIAPKGKVLIEADYSQMELRVAAMLSGDTIMIDFFARGVDFHLEAAKLIAPIFKFEPDEIDADHPLRNNAKTVVFSTLYGDTEAGLAAKLGVDRKVAARLRAAILGQFVRLKVYCDECLRDGRKTGLARTWWDGREYRVRPLWRIADADDASRETAERSTWNTPVQGTAAEFMNNTLGKFQKIIEAKRLPAKQILTVYDSAILEVEEAAAPDVMGELNEVMLGWNSMGVKLKADFKKGDCWGELEKVAV